MATEDHSDSGIAGMADLMDAAQAVVHPESARLHGVIGAEVDTDQQAGSSSLASARADGFTPVLLLGQGGSADVWRCADEGLYREIAAKVIRPDSQHSSEAYEALLRCEAEVLSRLNHPGIVHVIRHGGRGNSSYLAMQFVDGDALLVHCRVLGLDLDQRLSLFGRVLEIVVYLHGAGVVHGDLKPEHILIREGGHPVLIDFGLAARWQYAEQVAAIPLRIGGSGPYCPPEVNEGVSHRPDPRQDVYALGVILRGLLDGADADWFGGALVRLCEQATQPDPADRYPDAAAMLLAFEEVIAAKAIAEDGVAVSQPKQASANKFVFTALSALLLLAIGFSLWLPIGGRDQAAGDRGDAFRLPRNPMQLSQRAGLLEGVLSDVRLGRLDVAGESLAPVVNQESLEQAPWEVRHLQSRVEDAGLAFPFTEDPYKAGFVIDAAYDPHSGTLAYIRSDDLSQEIWMRQEGGEPRPIARTSKFFQKLAISPDAKHLAGLVRGGEVVVWTLPEGDEDLVAEQSLPRKKDAKRAWFGADADRVFIFSFSTRRVECWPITEQAQVDEPLWSIDACDHAYPLLSGEGLFIVATQSEEKSTRLRLIDERGAVVRSLEMEDRSLPVCADTLPDEGAMICLGMPNGYVRLYDPKRGWLEPSDLGVNQGVTTVLYSPTESRVFAGMGRVHVLDTDGQLMMRLGARDATPQLMTSLYYSPEDASLIGVSLYQAWRWSTSPGVPTH